MSFAITTGNDDELFAIDNNGNLTVENIILADAESVYPLTIQVSSSCGSYEHDVDITVLPVEINIRPKEGGEIPFLLDHYVGTDTTLDTFWVVPETFVVEVELPEIASPADYTLVLFDNSAVGLYSTSHTFEFEVTPPVGGGAAHVWADVVLAVDPTVQVASDDEEPSFSDIQKDINNKVKSWIGDLAQSGFESALSNQIKGPFELVKDHITNDIIPQLEQDPTTDPNTITELQAFRDSGLDALQSEMVGKVADIVFDSFLHTGHISVRDGSAAREALDGISAVDVGTAGDKLWEIAPTVKFALTQEFTDKLFNADIDGAKEVLRKEHVLYSEVQLGVKYSWNTQSYVYGKMTVSGLQQDPRKMTYKGNIDVYNVDWGGRVITFSLSTSYTPATGAHDGNITIQLQ